MSIGEIKLESIVESSTVHWQIKNFSSIDTTPGVRILSPVFHTTQLNGEKLKWQLELYPGGRSEEIKDCVGLFLSYLNERKVSVCYELCILDDKHNKVRSLIKERLFEVNHTWGKCKFALKKSIYDETKKVLSNDTLLISCTITVKSMKQDDEHYDADGEARAHYEKLLEDGEMSDVTFEIEDKQMRLHKAVITSLSPVFLAMFQHQMKEKESSVVKITDVKYQVMKELFRYIYVRKVNGIETIVEDLLVAADKYAVQGLKILCERSLVQRLNVDGALPLLELAVKYNTTILKSEVVEFVVNRLKEFVDRPEFERVDGICKDELLREMSRRN